MIILFIFIKKIIFYSIFNILYVCAHVYAHTFIIYIYINYIYINDCQSCICYRQLLWVKIYIF